MVEKTKSENKSAENKSAEKKPTTANKNQNAVIQKDKTNPREAKKNETPLMQETDARMKDFPMTLEEFCTRLSQEKNQVEMIGGFYAHERLSHEKLSSEKSTDEKTSQHLLDTEANFKTRFDNFCTLPVES